MNFKVIDKQTGKEADTYEIALHEEWAQSLVYCDMAGFAILEDGTLLLADECGNFEYCDGKRFKVVFEEDRPHGEWIVRRNMQGAHIYSVCSKCNVPYLDIEFPNFCPNCGADMREGDEK